MSGRIVRMAVVVGIVALTLMSLHSAVAADRKTSKMKDTKIITDAVKKIMGEVKLGELEEEGITIKILEVKVEKDGNTYEVKVTPDGKVLEIESKIDNKILPKKVAETIDKLAKGETIKEVQRVEKHASVEIVPLKKPDILFEAEWIMHGREVEVLIDENGKVVKGIMEDGELEASGQVIENEDDDGEQEEIPGTADDDESDVIEEEY